ncbi:MAG: DUF695 domain-containing protein [Defluviitaleaceae bacterium]|nr:DUF695 domain-containing protein [Defluviitaleaceae bacterium]
MNKDKMFFSDSWEFFPCNINNQSFSIRFDLAVGSLDDETKAKYPHILELSIYPNEVTGEGFPTPAEFGNINKIEDSFSCGHYDMRNIGVITGGDRVRFIFCCDEKAEKEAENMVKILLGDNANNIKYSCKIFSDDNFLYYHNTLAPNIYEQSWIMNRHVCTNLENQGDAFKILREIDFFCYFASEKHIENVAKELIKQGFKEISREKTEEGDYSLQLTLEGIPNFEWINEITANIIDLLKDTDGYFDGWGSPICKD